MAFWFVGWRPAHWVTLVRARASFFWPTCPPSQLWTSQEQVPCLEKKIPCNSLSLIQLLSIILQFIIRYLFAELMFCCFFQLKGKLQEVRACVCLFHHNMSSTQLRALPTGVGQRLHQTPGFGVRKDWIASWFHLGLWTCYLPGSTSVPISIKWRLW